MRFFITDLDKTFLRSDLSISNFSKDVWNSFKLPISVATARSFTGVKKLLKGLRLEFPMILLDGALIASTNKIYKINAIKKDLADTIIDEISKEYKTLPLIVGFDEIEDEKFLYPKELNCYQKELLQNYKNDKRVLNVPNLRGLKHNLKIVYLGDEKLKEIEIFIQKNFNVETKLSLDPYQHCYFLTILDKNADKGIALKELENIIDINPKDVTAFGDSLNDIGMFKKSGKAVAVKNALDEVKKEADIILKETNDEDAVAKYLSKI